MTSTKKVFSWEFVPSAKDTVLQSPEFAVPTSAECESPADLWTIHFSINKFNQLFQIAMSRRTGRMTSVPDFIQSGKFELIYEHRSGSISINGATNKLIKTKDRISFPTQKISVEELANQLRNKIRLQFIYTVPPTANNCWDFCIFAKRNQNVLEWTGFHIPSGTGEPDEIWTISLHIDHPNKLFYFSMNTKLNAKLKCVPDFIKSGRFQLKYYTGDSDVIEGASGKLNKTRQFITFQTTRKSIEKLSNKFLEGIHVKFIFENTLPTPVKAVAAGLTTTTVIPVAACHETAKTASLATESVTKSNIEPLVLPGSDDHPQCSTNQCENVSTNNPFSREQHEAQDDTASYGSGLSTGPLEVETVPITFPHNPQSSPVLHDLNQMLVQQDNCDVTFKCGGLCIGAHQTILEGRCPYFKKFLFGDNPFLDIDVDTLMDTLQFIYTGCAPNVANTATRLLIVADAISMPALRQVAEQALHDSQEEL